MDDSDNLNMPQEQLKTSPAIPPAQKNTHSAAFSSKCILLALQSLDKLNISGCWLLHINIQLGMELNS